MHVEDRVSRQASTSETTPDLTQASPLPTELGVLRVEVAVLRERVAAAERVLAERDQRIRDLRGSLGIVAASIPAEGAFPQGSGNGSNETPNEVSGGAPLARLRQVMIDATRDRGHPERP